MSRTAKGALIGLTLVLVAAGFTRLRLDVDVFNLLPSGSRWVEGLELYQRHFGSSQELILTVRASDTATAERAVQELSEGLVAAGLARHVIDQSPLRDDPAEFAELLAFLWLNRPPADFAAMGRRFEPGARRPTLDATLERMTTSLRPQEVARLGVDPYGLSDLMQELELPLEGGASDPFASADGRFRILFAVSPYDAAGFWRVRGWVAETRRFTASWRQAWMESHGGEELAVGVTGNPAFVAETGSGLLGDMQRAAAGTLVLVAGLFWLMHRRWTPLLWLVGLLALILVVTAALGGVVFGTLNAVSLGFAAILMGLSADYGLILYQEFAVHPERRLGEHRRIVGPSILWAAATTAGAFVMVGRSSLPGMRQLGTLVAIGILVAAAFMLLAFLPPLVARRGAAAPRRPPSDRGVAITLASSGRVAWAITAVLIAVSALVLALRAPAVDTGTEELGPKNSRARVVLQEIEREIGGFDDALWLIVAGDDEATVAARLDAVGEELDRAVAAGRLEGYALPGALWPRPQRQATNRDLARELTSQRAGALESARQAGFAETSLRLTEAVFEAWGRFAAADGVVWPERPGARWVFRQFAAREAGRHLVLGRLEAAAATSTEELLRLAEELEPVGGQLFAWSLLSDTLLGAIERDVRRVLVPMGAVLLVLLGFAFRRAGELGLSLATLGLTLLSLLGVMGLCGWTWNLMNVMSLPLLFGAGVDYSIHMQLALRRHRGEVAGAYQTVGRAILLCGASTSAGFATLAMATNAGLASLGRVCAVGVLLASLIAVILLPAWWRTLPGRNFLVRIPTDRMAEKWMNAEKDP